MNSMPQNLLRLAGTLCVLVWGLSLWNCSQKKQPLTEQDVATTWADMSLFLTKNTPANTPTYASRCLGYIGLTMYESVVPGYPAYQSLAGQLNGLNKLPLPEKGKSYNWVLALNAGQANILRAIYNQTSDANKAKIDSLEQVVLVQYADPVTDAATVRRSVTFGKSVAAAIADWSATDGGHRGYLKNFDKTMKHPTRLGCWQPPLYAQSFSHFPLHPHWGENRPFLQTDGQIAPPVFIPYSTDTNSAYFRQYKQVYEKEKVLTQAEKEIAIWWSDDPDETFTPPGHSYYLATRAIQKTRPPLIKCAQTYAEVGMAVADAFINCWKWKYQFFSERPNTFIPQHIDQQWESFWPDPPFPAFPSGHAIQGAAAATVLTSLYGNSLTLIDSMHVGRKRDLLRDVDFKPRTFHSFWEVALETANSRFYGGIHTPQDNQAGLDKGRVIGDHISQLHWTSRHPTARQSHNL